MPRKHVFVSYAREDKDFARELSRRLRAPWQDVQQLRGGETWQERIDTAIRKAAALVVVVSPASSRSQFVTYEWAFALGAGVPVIPVMRRSTKLHPRLSVLQFIDFTKRKAWVSLRQALPSMWRKRRAMPLIRARFLLDDQTPQRIGRRYAVSLTLANAPRNAKSVTYEIYDETAELLRLTSSRSATAYAATFMTDGDVLVRASIQTASGKTVVDTPLFDALRRSHGRTLRKSVRAALRHIEKN